MKRFLKPTGQILTTAVFTSTALEPFAAATAQTMPTPPTPEGDGQTNVSPSSRRQAATVDEKSKTIVPPEASSSREFLQAHGRGDRHRLVASSTRGTSSIQATVPLSLSAPSLPSEDAPDRPVRAASSTPNATASSPAASPQQTAVSAKAGMRLTTTSLTESAPSLPADSMSAEMSVGQERSLSTSAQTLSQAASTRPATAAPTATSTIPTMATPTASSEPATSGQPLQRVANSDHSTNDSLGETREWLDSTLANIVERDRSYREAELRDNLMDLAHQHLGRRNIAEARRIANNPVLSESERIELQEAIADVEDSRLYPFVSAERAAASRSTTGDMPSREWLLARVNSYVNNTDTDCVALSVVPNSGDRIAYASTASESLLLHADTTAIDEEFVSGGEFLAGVGHQAPSIHANKSSRPSSRAMGGSGGSSATQPTSAQPPATSTDSIARANNCSPTLGQHIGGVTFATLSGYEQMNQSIGRSNQWQMIFPLPTSAPITSRFGWRIHPIYGNRRFHAGVDFGAPTGTPVLAALPGRVQTSGHISGYGLTIIVENEDLQQRNLYAHMSRLAVPAGTWVDQGTVIGWVGSTGNSTGPHLHFEVQHRTGDRWVAVDPLQAAAQMLANRRRN